MNNRIPWGILLTILSLIVCFFIGMALGSLNTPKNSGLAGGAIVFFWGVIGGVMGLVAGIFASIRLDLALIKKINAGLGIIAICIGGWVFYRYRTLNSPQNPPVPDKTLPTKPTVPVEKMRMFEPGQNQILPAGLGIASIPISLNQTTPYLYANDTQSEPVDSIMIDGSSEPASVNYAPPWLIPEMMKLDYQIFLFRAVGISRNRVQVLTNAHDGRRHWLDREQVDFTYWPDFLIGVHSVEILNPQDNPVRIKPMSHASPIKLEGEVILQVQSAQEEWLKVGIFDQSYKLKDTGWVRWRKGGQMLVRYQMLS